MLLLLGDLFWKFGQFSSEAAVTFAYTYDSKKAVAGKMSDITIKAAAKALIGDQNDKVELEIAAEYQYPCVTTVSASGSLTISVEDVIEMEPIHVEVGWLAPASPK